MKFSRSLQNARDNLTEVRSGRIHVDTISHQMLE